MTSKRLQLKHSEVMSTYEHVIQPEAEHNWFAFTCSEQNLILLCGFGKGGLDDLKNCMKGKDICMGFLVLGEESFALISFTSPSASAERNTSALMISKEAQALFIHHFFFDTESLDEITLENIKSYPVAQVLVQTDLKKRKTVKKKKNDEGAIDDLEGLAKKKKDRSAKTEKSEKSEKSSKKEKGEKSEKGEKGEEGEEGTGLKKRGTVKRKKVELLAEDPDAKKSQGTDEAKPVEAKDGLKRAKSLRNKAKSIEELSNTQRSATLNPSQVLALNSEGFTSSKSKAKSVEQLGQRHPKDQSFDTHSRDISTSSEASEDKTYAKAVAHNLAKVSDELMFLKDDIILVLEKKSDSCWIGSCCGVEGSFHPKLVTLLPPGFRPHADGSDSEGSVDSDSDSLTDYEDEDGSETSSQASDQPARNQEFTEPMVVEWLYSAGFPQYVDMHQKGILIDEGEVFKDHGFLTKLQLQSLLKRIRFLNERLSDSGTKGQVPVTVFQPTDATPISPTWNDAQNPNNTFPSAGQTTWTENLTRSKSKKKKKSKNIYDLDPHEMEIARKLAILSVTAMLEKRSKNKVQNFALKTLNKMVGKKEEKSSEKKVFGIDLPELVERTGVPSKWTNGVLPNMILKMLESLEKEEMMKTVGIFRVPGKQGRINQFRETCDAHEGDIDFSALNAADLTGLLKLFFKELPDSLFTSELYKSYISIASLSNKRVQIENLQLLSILLPKENRDLAACLLKILSTISLQKDENKMDARNIALVLAPTLFGDRTKKNSKHHSEVEKDLQRQNKLAEVLQVMIECQSVLWHLPVDLQDQLEYTAQGNKSEKKKKWFFSTSKHPTL